MEPGKLTLYRSSAGSGKTFALARDYLILALQRPDYFHHILAVTFTNKATAEMKMRVLRYLHDFSRGVQHPPFEEVKNALGISEAAMAEKSRVVLSDILHQYFFFSVQTIDSFFQKVVRSFAREAGLPAGYEIELDDKRIIEAVVDRMLDALGAHKNLTQWLGEYALDSIQEGTWDIRKNTRSLVREVFKEQFLKIQNDLPDVDTDLDRLKKLIGRFHAVRKDFEQEMKAHGIKALNILDHYDLIIEDFYHGKSGVLSILNKIKKCDFDSPNSRLAKALSGEGPWFTKTSKKAPEIEAAMAGGLLDAIGTLVITLEEKSPAYFTAIAAIKNFHLLGLLSWLRNASREIKSEEELLTTQDITEFLKEIIEGSTAPFIYEKIGTRYHHYLLDEFQDTSAMQWDNIRPLLHNSLSEGYANLIVGDAKQSIYRWRSGDYELMTTAIARDLGVDFINEEVLERNFRSKSDIIGFNNAVFTKGAQILHDHLAAQIEAAPMSDEDRAGFKKYLDQIRTVYQDVVQAPFDRSEYKGMAEVRLLEVDYGEEDEDYLTVMIDAVGDRLKALKNAGVRMGDIGILVRSNSEGSKFIKVYYEAGLDSRFGPVISSDSLFLKNSRAVALLLNAMRYIIDPVNYPALTNLLHIGYALHDHPAKFLENITRPEDLRQYLPKDWNHARLRSMEIGTLIEHLARMFRLQNLSGEFSFILAFQSVILDYTRREKGDIQAFLEWWDETGDDASITVPDDIDAIRLLTIHKSKGLQYKVVIVPFLNWDLDQKSDKKGGIIWASTREDPFNAIPSFPVVYREALSGSYFNIQYFEERLQRNLDHLNFLYVALTRAEDGFFGFAKKWNITKDKTPNSTVAKLLITTFKSADFPLGQWDEEASGFLLNDFSHISPSTAPEKESGETGLDIFYSGDWEEKVAIKKPRFGLHSDPGIKQKIDYGLLVHEVLSRVIYADDAGAALEQIQMEGLISADEAEVLKSEVEKVLSHEIAGRWFSREWEVRTEAPILLPDGKEYRIDRVLIRDQECMVIDFKTGQEDGANERQVKRYMGVLSKMGYQKISGYLVYLDPIKIKSVAF